MRKIRKNASVKIRKVLESHQWEFFHSGNDYKGGEIGSVNHINHVVEDIELGHAHMFQDGDTFIVRYAGHCRWVSQ